MMKGILRTAMFLALALPMAMVSCKKDPTQGCTDPLATNYDLTVDEDDGSCDYLDSTITVWANGAPGVWGLNAATGAIEILGCQGQVDTITLNPDTLGNGDQALYVMRDAMGDFFIAARILNPQYAFDFANGYLVFDAMKGPNSTIDQLDLNIHGSTCFTPSACEGNVCLSSPVTINTDNLTDSTWSTYTIPLTDFARRYLQSSDVLFCMKDRYTGAGGDTLLFVRNIYWKTNL